MANCILLFQEWVMLVIKGLRVSFQEEDLSLLYHLIEYLE
jgi:hypothetical protein